jgi:hypothetical protein
MHQVAVGAVDVELLVLERSEALPELCQAVADLLAPRMVISPLLKTTSTSSAM